MRVTTNREVRHDDRRSKRTRRMLGQALVSLMLEKRYDTITVQEIIDRANVGRSTFYAHFLDKEDLLQNESTDLVDRLVAHMDHSAAGNPIVPSLELLQHLYESQDLYRALVRGRAIQPVLKNMQAHLSRHVQHRLTQRMPAGRAPEVPLAVLAQHIAGTLITLFQWWVDRDMPESPEQINAYFLQLIRPTVMANAGIDIDGKRNT
jgi:AcrR family transcriptional regulator